MAIIGCGGLGSNAATMLLRSGVRHLTLIDFDVVEEGNLNRQSYFRDQLGEPKTEALAEILLRIQPDAHLELHQLCVTEENLVDLVARSDVVIEAVDGVETKAMIGSVLMRSLPEMPIVTASGIAGFDSANTIETQLVADGFYLVGDLQSDVRDGLPLMASRVMVAAAHEAHAAIRILLGHPEP